MTGPSRYDQFIPGGTTRQQPRSRYDAFVPQETEEEKRQREERERREREERDRRQGILRSALMPTLADPGVTTVEESQRAKRFADLEKRQVERELSTLGERAANRFKARGASLASAFANMAPGDIGSEAAKTWQELSRGIEGQVPAAKTITGKIASGVGYVGPDVLATILGGRMAIGAAEASALGRVGATGLNAAQRAQATAELASRGNQAARLAEIFRGSTAKTGIGGLAQRATVGAVASAPLVTIPGALADDPRLSVTGGVGEMYGVDVPKPLRLAGDLAVDVGAGFVGEGLMAGGGRGLSRLAQAFGIGDGAAGRAAGQGPSLPTRNVARATYAAEQAAGETPIFDRRLGDLRRRAEQQALTVTDEQMPLDVNARLQRLREIRERMGQPAIEVVPAIGGNVVRQQEDAAARAARETAEREARRQRAVQIPDAEATARLEAAAAQATPTPTPGLIGGSPLGVAGAVGQIAAGAGAGYSLGETPEEQALYASMLSGVPAGRKQVIRSADQLFRSTLPQEVRSVGRFGFVQLPEAYRAAPNLALETEHVGNVIRATERQLAGLGAASQNVEQGAGLFGGDNSPNALYRFVEDATDDQMRQATAMRGIAYGQDQQLWYRPSRQTDTPDNVTSAIVVAGPKFGELSDDAINAIVNRLRASDALGVDGGATRDGNHLLLLNLKRYTEMDDAQFESAVQRALADVAEQYDIQPYRTTYYTEHLDGTPAYVRSLAGRPDAIQSARDALVEAIPEYIRYAERTGSDVAETIARLDGRVAELDQLLKQIGSPPPRGNTKGSPLAEVAKTIYKEFPRLRSTRLEAQVPEMVSRLKTVVDSLIADGVIPRELAEDWYRTLTGSQRQVAQLAMPEVRQDPKYVLYTIVNSILSSGQEVPVESRVGLNVFDQYLRTKRFTMLNPDDPAYATAYRQGTKIDAKGREVLARGLRSPSRVVGILGESAPAAPRTVNHEMALQRLDALVQAYGEEGAVERLLGTVPIMQGKTVKEQRPALLELFGPKIGQYAMDKLNIPGSGSTIDLWMARMDYFLRGDAAGGIRNGKLNDVVTPLMRRRMQTVLEQYAQEYGMSPSSAQALAWYAIKYAFSKAGGTMKPQTYATLASATTDALTRAGKKYAQPIVQGVGKMRTENIGWSSDEALSKYLKRTGQTGQVAPQYGGYAGTAFDIGGAVGEALKTPIGRQVLTKGGVYGAGEIVESVGEGGETYDESPFLRETGRAMKGLALITAAYPAIRAGSRVGGAKLRDTIAQTPQGRAVLNSISRDILIDPRIREIVEATITEMSRYRAIGRELAAEARKLGPAGDRLVSDLVEMENFENVVLDPNEMATAVALANRIADSVDKLGLAKVEQGLISQETYQARQRDYLRRIYARYAGEEAMEGVPSGAQAQPFRIKGEKQRLDLSPEQRNELGEIREASYRLTETFGRGGKDIATARMFLALSDVPGVIEPQYKQIFEEAAMARGLRDAAIASGDKEAARDASRAYLEAKATLDKMRQTFKKGDEYVTLPDTPGLGVLRGAVVRRDAAEYLLMVDDWADTKHVWDKALQAWKKIHTVYNPGTHVGNFASNAIITALAGIPLPMQPIYMRSAYKDLKAYGPATRFLTENGILERGLPLYGVTPVKGLAEDKAALRTLARTTRPETQAALKKQGITPMSAVELMARERGNKITRAYALEDGVYRVMLFQRYVQDGMEPEAAMKKMMEALPNYDTRSPILKALKNSVSPFIMFPAKYIPAALNLIMEHPERWVAVAAMWGALNEASRRLYEPLEQKDLPPNQRGYNYLIPGRIQVDAIARPAFNLLGIEPPPGDKYTFDVARWTPFSAITGSPAPGAIATQISEDIPGILQPGGPIADIGALFVNRDPFTGEEVIQPGMTGGEKARAVGGRLASLALPSAASFQAPRVIKDILRQDPAAAAIDMMGLVGLRPSVVRPGMEEWRQTKKYEQAVEGIKTRLERELRKSKNPERNARLEEEAVQAILREEQKYMDALTVRVPR